MDRHGWEITGAIAAAVILRIVRWRRGGSLPPQVTALLWIAIVVAAVLMWWFARAPA